MTDWTKEIIDELTALASSGLSTSRMATAINTKFSTSLTRNAVIGKMHRLGLSSGLTKKDNGQKRRVAKPARWPAPGADGRQSKPQALRFVTPPVPVPDDTVQGTVTMLQLEDGMCRWPMGDFYCGRRTEGKRVTYCSAHRKAGTVMPRRYVRRAQ